MSIGNIEVVCPMCDNNMEIPGEQKNKRIECSKCGNGFVAYEAVRCKTCGKLRHPRHECWTCVPDNDFARKYRETVAGEALTRLPEDMGFWDKIRSNLDFVEVVCPNCNRSFWVKRSKLGSDVDCPQCRDIFVSVEAVKCEKCGNFRHPEHTCWQCFPDNDDARAYRERRKREMLDRLPELWDAMGERIEELEDRIAELESELEELKEKEDGE